MAELDSNYPYFSSPQEIQDQYDSLPDIIKRGVIIRRSENSAQYAVDARAQELPYKDESFDLVMSVMAFPMNLDENGQFDGLQELIRVTKKGGEIRLWPVNLTQSGKFTKKINSLKRERWTVEDLGYGQGIEHKGVILIKPV